MLMTKRYAVVVETIHVAKKPTFKIKRFDSRRAALLELDRLEDKHDGSWFKRVYMVDSVLDSNVLLPA